MVYQIHCLCKESNFWVWVLQVSTQQAEMDSKFVAMKRTITLLEKYDQKLPDMTQKFYAAAPQRYVLFHHRQDLDRIRKIVSFEHGKKIEEGVFSSCHERGTKKKF